MLASREPRSYVTCYSVIGSDWAAPQELLIDVEIKDGLSFFWRKVPRSWDHGTMEKDTKPPALPCLLSKALTGPGRLRPPQ